MTSQPDTAINHRQWVESRRQLRRLGWHDGRLPASCLEHRFTPAVRVLRGIGPLCGPCIQLQERAPSHQVRLITRCGCGRDQVYCPLATRLYRRASTAHALLLETREDDPRKATLGSAYTNMLLALRHHHQTEVDR